MRKSKQLFNLPVFSLEEGQKIGKVKGLVVNPSQKAVVALIVEEKKWLKEQKFIPFRNIYSVGKDAITVEQSSFLQKGAALPEIVKLTRNRIGILGTRVVLENGTILGQADEFHIDLQTGEIIGLELSEGVLNNVIQGHAYLDATFIRTLGKQVTICADDCLNHLVKIESGLQDTMRTVKNTAALVWAGTVSKGRELGTGMSLPFKRKTVNTNNNHQKQPAPKKNHLNKIIPEDIIPEENKPGEELNINL